MTAVICMIPTVPFAIGIAMTKASHSKAPPMLIKWHFVPDKKDHHGPEGEARYWWSDGSKTEETIASYVDALARLKAIQDNGGLQLAG